MKHPETHFLWCRRDASLRKTESKNDKHGKNPEL